MAGRMVKVDEPVRGYERVRNGRRERVRGYTRRVWRRLKSAGGRVKAGVKKHKKKILLAGGTIAVAGGAYYIIKRRRGGHEIVQLSEGAESIGSRARGALERVERKLRRRRGREKIKPAVATELMLLHTKSQDELVDTYLKLAQRKKGLVHYDLIHRESGDRLVMKFKNPVEAFRYYDSLMNMLMHSKKKGRPLFLPGMKVKFVQTPGMDRTVIIDFAGR